MPKKKGKGKGKGKKKGKKDKKAPPPPVDTEDGAVDEMSKRFFTVQIVVCMAMPIVFGGEGNMRSKRGWENPCLTDGPPPT